MAKLDSAQCKHGLDSHLSVTLAHAWILDYVCLFVTLYIIHQTEKPDPGCTLYGCMFDIRNNLVDSDLVITAITGLLDFC